MRCGRLADLLPDLSASTVRYPLDERIAGQFMLALYLSGRRSDALRHYQHTREQLVEKLGAEPGPDLRRLHQGILTTDPVPATLGSVRTPVPRQLPIPPRLFAGRTRELAILTDALDSQAEHGAAVVISAIGGTGGIGKTWLALQWAHQNVDRFPDGQLFVNLRGFDPSGERTSPETVLRGFLSALGVDPTAIPTDLNAQEGLFRSLMASRQMLVLLDNAADPAQVTPLLPGGRSMVLVTSRDRLTSMITAQGARAVPVDVLTEPEARALLAARFGHQQLAAEAGAIAELLVYCAGLPLALSIVAGRAEAHPDFPLAILAANSVTPPRGWPRWTTGSRPPACRRCCPGPMTPFPPSRRRCSGCSDARPARTSGCQPPQLPLLCPPHAPRPYCGRWSGFAAPAARPRPVADARSGPSLRLRPRPRRPPRVLPGHGAAAIGGLLPAYRVRR
ncbi:BTAD domain-containing putative transcriptional regulator [Actinocrispum wychmicini]|uniref:BTAD domain-containing putative transcriptional regulator n=1 Tax=Actinocrispum wychmicini TaxID=1213861 RepID=UPI002441BF44|nr:BTAD domain-containing putative transcriptional regulator [Actinocrispum wychmicini]